MKSLINVNLLGGPGAFRTRNLNCGENVLMNADIINNPSNRASGVLLLEDLNALILAPYTDNMAYYGVAPKINRTDAMTADWKIKYGIPEGWVINWERMIGDSFGDTLSPADFVPGGKYVTNAGVVEFKKWQDFFYKLRIEQLYYGIGGNPTYPDGIDQFTPIFEVGGDKLSNVGLTYWHQMNNVAALPKDVLPAITRWTLRSYDPSSETDKPQTDIPTIESSGKSQTRFLKENQGLLLSFKRVQPFTCNFMDSIIDNFTEFALYWKDANNDEYVMTFIFTIHNTMRVEFSRKVTTGPFHDPYKQTGSIALKGSIGDQNHIDVFILFVDGKIVLLDTKLNRVATID